MSVKRRPWPTWPGHRVSAELFAAGCAPRPQGDWCHLSREQIVKLLADICDAGSDAGSVTERMKSRADAVVRANWERTPRTFTRTNSKLHRVEEGVVCAVRTFRLVSGFWTPRKTPTSID